jgi:ubiquitin carboxyl-terminal hydrolase 5/13
MHFDAVIELMSMGFSENGCKRAVLATSNGTTEAAMEWIFSHMDDPDFNSPLSSSSKSNLADVNAGNSFESCSPEIMANLTSMGFSQNQVECALSYSNNDPDRAAEWLFRKHGPFGYSL